MSEIPESVRPLQQYAGIGASDVFFQRQHQFDLGYTVDHDAEHHSYDELARIGSCYILYGCAKQEDRELQTPVANWPKDSEIEWTEEDTAYGYIVKGAAFMCAALDLKYALEQAERQRKQEEEQADFAPDEEESDE